MAVELQLTDLTKLSGLQISNDQRVGGVCDNVTVVPLDSHFINFISIERLQHNPHAGRQVLHNHLQNTARTMLTLVIMLHMEGGLNKNTPRNNMQFFHKQSKFVTSKLSYFQQY